MKKNTKTKLSFIIDQLLMSTIGLAQQTAGIQPPKKTVWQLKLLTRIALDVFFIVFVSILLFILLNP